MRSTRQVHKQARQLFQVCLVNGRLDEDRVRRTVAMAIDAHRRGGLAVLSRFQRLVRLDRGRHSATIASATPLSIGARAHIEAGLTRTYGELDMSYRTDPALIGGVRISVGSDVYDGSVRGRLDSLAARVIDASYG